MKRIISTFAVLAMLFTYTAFSYGVIFRTKEVDISERVVEENSKEGKVVALESQVKIKNANANKGYRFSFFLPKGFKLVDSRTYEGMKGKKNC